MSGKGPYKYCFVCDISVTNRYFSLATCRTQSSRRKLVEKLGHLVGDKYMVVISEEDVICRSCFNLMNTLDRLELEMGSVRRVVLRFLERKYLLEEGELANQVPPKPLEPEKLESPDFMVRKKSGEQDADSEPESNLDDPRSRIWMQCDQCQYTTNYTSFVNHHVRPEVCLDCEAPMMGGACARGCGNLPETEEADTEEAEPEASEGMDVFLNGEEEEGERPALYTLQVVDEEGEELTEGVTTVEEEGVAGGGVRQVLTVTGEGSVEMMQVLWDETTNSPAGPVHL